MKPITLQKPKIARMLEPKSMADLYVDDDFSLGSCLIEDSHFENQAVSRIALDSARIRNCRFSGTDFGRSDFVDIVFENCDFSNANFSEAGLHRVEFRDCKLVGTTFSDCRFKNVLFEASAVNLASFFQNHLSNVRFSDCLAKGIYLYECLLKLVEFSACELDTADFFGTSLRGIDISTSTFEKLNVSHESLQGCLVSSEQAVRVAEILGLVVVE